MAISANSEEEDSSFNNVTEISNNEEKSDELIAQESSTGIPTSLIRKKSAFNSCSVGMKFIVFFIS